MDVLLIGSSGVGKTTHLVASYGIYNNGVNLKTGRIFGKGKLSFQDNSSLNRLYSMYRGSGKMPATSHLGSFSTSLICNGLPIMSINYHDSRGQMLAMKRGSREFEELHERFRKADCVMVYFRADELISDNRYDIQKRSINLINLQYLMNERIESGKGCMIVINITCCDLISGSAKIRIDSFLRGFLECDSDNIFIYRNWMVCLPGREKGVLEPVALCLYFGLGCLYSLGSTMKRKRIKWSMKALNRYLSTTGILVKRSDHTYVL